VGYLVKVVQSTDYVDLGVAGRQFYPVGAILNINSKFLRPVPSEPLNECDSPDNAVIPGP
jgi:hypothetical protein